MKISIKFSPVVTENLALGTANDYELLAIDKEENEFIISLDKSKMLELTALLKQHEKMSDKDEASRAFALYMAMSSAAIATNALLQDVAEVFLTRLLRDTFETPEEAKKVVDELLLMWIKEKVDYKVNGKEIYILKV